MNSFSRLNNCIFILMIPMVMLVGCSSTNKSQELVKDIEKPTQQDIDQKDMHCAGLSKLKKGMAYEDVGIFVPELTAFPCKQGAKNTLRLPHVEAMFDSSCKLAALKSNVTCTVNEVNRGMELLQKKLRSKDITKQ